MSRPRKLARDVGFQFVDVKACHGYLLHEFLGARRRPGKFGGDLAGRSRLLLTIIDRMRDECPDLLVGVRLSVFDIVPYQAGDGPGRADGVRRSVACTSSALAVMRGRSAAVSILTRADRVARRIASAAAWSR